MLSNRDWYRRYPMDELFNGPLAVLTNEELGFLERIRLHAWIHKGLSTDQKFLSDFAERFGVMRRRFPKIWARIRPYLLEQDGRLVYIPDEAQRSNPSAHRRLMSADLSKQRKQAGIQ